MYILDSILYLKGHPPQEFVLRERKRKNITKCHSTNTYIEVALMGCNEKLPILIYQYFLALSFSIEFFSKKKA